MLGAVACLEAAPRPRSLGILWFSTYGAREAALAALAEAASGEPVMPFTFIATQPHLLATLLAQRGAPVARAAFVHVPDPGWPTLLELAQTWLGTCDAVLLGYVEEGEPHRSDWRLLRSEVISSA
jgi:nucleotide-binding universal stress UspA family protein